jgi:death-on-curing protein
MIRFLQAPLVRAMHLELIAEYGGSAGVRDEGLLDSALARPHHLAAYGEPDFFALAASYAFGISRNHPFIDGNKRVAFVCMAVFLELNGWTLTASQQDATETMLRLAAGELNEEALVAWVTEHAAPNDEGISAVEKR